MGVDGRQGTVVSLAGRSFGQLLVAFRHAAGLTQEELAEASGVSVRAIRDMERGRVHAPQRRTASILATALRLTGEEESHFLAAARTGRVGGRARPAPTGRKPDLAAALTPRELPSAGELIGRDTAAAKVGELAERAASGVRSSAVVISVHGQPGVGKTAFTVGVGNRISEFFPDGQIFVDLGGTDRRPLDPGEAMVHLLRSLAVPDDVQPGSLASQAGLYRTLTRERRLLVVLDNVADEAQVRPLLPAGERCLVLITSRRKLTGLDCAARITLDALVARDALRLLASIVGADRVAAEPEAAQRLAAICGGLPLALRIAGNRLASRPEWTIDHLVAQLGNHRRRLATLTAGDLGVAAAFEVSYRQLDASQATMFRHLSLVPGADFGVSLAARLAGVDEITAAGTLDELVDSGLLTATSARYGCHDLVRLFARERLEHEDSPAQRAVAHGRMVDWLLATTLAAAKAFDPDARLANSAGPPGGGQAPPWTQAQSFLEVESVNWLAALREAAQQGRHGEVAAVARAMHWYSDTATHRHPWDDVFSLGVAAARAAGRPHDEAALLNFLGWALFVCRDRPDEGYEVHQRALALARQVGDRREEAWALAYCAVIRVRAGQPEEGNQMGLAAVEAFRDAGYPLGEHMALLQARCNALIALGRFDEAIDIGEQVLSYCRSRAGGLTPTGALVAQASCTGVIGRALGGLGRWAEAVAMHAESLALFRRSGTPFGQAGALYRHGLATRELGDAALAAVSLRRALALFASLGSPWWQAKTLHALASVTGSGPQARELLERAVVLCTALDTAESRALATTLRTELGGAGER